MNQLEILFAALVYMYYRPKFKSSVAETPRDVRFTPVSVLFERGKLWYEDADFFKKKQ